MAARESGDISDDGSDDSAAEEFSVRLSGQVCRLKNMQTAQAAVRWRTIAGSAWRRVSGVPEGLSQLSIISPDRSAVIALPFDLTFQSNTPRGWPQLVFTVYGINSWGTETVIGYGRTHIPTTCSTRTKTIPLFVPRPATMLGEFMSWITGKSPELSNSDVLADGNDTYLLRTTSCGFVDLELNVIFRGFRELDYDNVPGIQQEDDDQIVVF